MFSSIEHCGFKQLHSTIYSKWSAGFLWKNTNEQRAALAGAAHTWFDDLRTSSIPKYILSLGFVQMSCSLQSWRHWKPSTFTPGSHFFLHQLLNNPHPPQHMDNASCTQFCSHPLTGGAGDPDQLSHYVAIANVMFCPNNYPETCTTSAATTNNPNPSSSHWGCCAVKLPYFRADLLQNKYVQKHLRGSNSMFK